MSYRQKPINVGERYGMIEVLEHAGSQGKGSGSYSLWKCRCDCGREVILPSYRMKRGLNASCGCMSTNHKESFLAYLQDSVKAARELYYPEEVVKDILVAKTEGEIERIMIKARHGGYTKRCVTK